MEFSVRIETKNNNGSFSETRFWMNGSLELSFTLEWAKGAVSCSELVCKEIQDILQSEGEVLISSFDYEVDFLSECTSESINLIDTVTGNRREVDSVVASAIKDGSIDSLGYKEIDYLLWLIGDFEFSSEK